MTVISRNISKQEKLKRLGSMRVKKNTLWAFLFIIVYKIVLDLSYYFVISQVWSYARFELHLNSLKLVESYLLLFIIFILMPKAKEKLSNVMIWLLIFFSYIPMLTLFAFMDQPRLYMYAVTGFWMLVFLLLKLPVISFPSLKESQAKAIRYLIFFSLTLIVSLMIYKYVGLFFNFDLTKVYEIRAKYVEMGISLAGYLFNWLAYIINPIFFALFLTKRKWIFTGLIIVLQLLLFSITGMKTFLFALPFILVSMWIITKKNTLTYMMVGLVGIILLGIFSYWLVGNLWVLGLFTNRGLLVPAQLSFLYYDFFSKNGYTFLSQHRIFRNFLNYPYRLDPPHLIGEVYFNRPECDAVNGLYGDAYMNFGFLGFVLWGILLVLILKLLDICSKKKDMRIAIASITMPVIILINSPLLTSLLTHGVWLLPVILYLLPRQK